MSRMWLHSLYRASEEEWGHHAIRLRREKFPGGWTHPLSACYKIQKEADKKELESQKEAAKTKKEADNIQANIVTVEDAHSRCPRCAYFGELEQMDASPYEWFSTEKTTLHIAVDDATGRITVSSTKCLHFGRFLPRLKTVGHAMYLSTRLKADYMRGWF